MEKRDEKGRIIVAENVKVIFSGVVETEEEKTA